MRAVGRWVVVPAIATLGCGHVEVHEMLLRAPDAFPSQSANTGGPVPMYSEPVRPSRASYDVALLQVFGYGADADAGHLAAALSSRASALACDAVVRVRIDQGWTRAHAFGVCVRWSPLASTGMPAPDAQKSAP
ncbi:MAG: hypothetical protein M3O50_09815 [Myxococcota bacterium]|nr:hypothetical protein [Myxococcota bacterium]